MKNKYGVTILLITLVVIFLLFLSYRFLYTNQDTIQEIACEPFKEKFDDYIQRRDLPIIDNPASLCYGLYVSSDFGALDPKWAVAELVSISGSQLMFEGISETAIVPMGFTNREISQYTIGTTYRIDMNNICRNFFTLVDSRYPSPILATFVKPEEVYCK